MSEPQYEVDGDDLWIRVPLDAIAEQVRQRAFGPVVIRDKQALGLAMGRELCDCEDDGEDYYINTYLDAAVVRLIESADPSIEFLETTS